MLKMTLTNTVTNSSTPVSVSDRRSISTLQSTQIREFQQNDDEAERLKLRSQSDTQNNTSVLNSSTVSSPRRRHSLGLSNVTQVPELHMKEHISHCIKLSTENKINLKNAFNLEIIDFMTIMVTKKKSIITDLQAASVTLDVSTKIYGYRVDSLYSVILKMGGGVDKQPNKNELISNELEECNENRQEDKEINIKTKKKKTTQNICSTESALKGNIESVYPSESIIGSGDSCSLDMLYQAILPNHAKSGFYYHIYNDVILDALDDTNEEDSNSPEYTIPAIENYSTLDICPSFADFKLLNWSQDDEKEKSNPTTGHCENGFQFDLDKTFLSTDACDFQPMNDIDAQDQESIAIPCKKNPEKVENIVDFRNIVAAQVLVNKPSEYSFIQKDFLHWAGPAYWKIKPLSKVLCSNSKIVETCHHTAVKKRKNIILSYEDVNSTFKKNFSFNRAVKTRLKSVPTIWCEKELTLPEDIHHDVLQLSKLYLCPLIVKKNNTNDDQSNEMEVPQNESFGFNNENDMLENCSDISVHNEEIHQGNDFDDLRMEDINAVESLAAFTGNNLVAAPQLTQKVCISYCLRAKKIDMRQLKRTIWNSLTSVNNDKKKDALTSESQNIKAIQEPKPFSTVYKSLSNMLSKMNAEALSLPIAFISLLHLANEKSLKLTLLEDTSDIVVDQD